ncbi:MAG: UspA domain protein [Hyphomicrobiales bacterium]|jgi:nucleotide-binding universal stress UspA family protein|nr:UspA domain protein [Hyphomicrobiales bacterium]
MIHGVKSLFAIAACAGEDEPRSSALPYAISFAAAAGAHLTAHWAAIRLVLPSAASSSTIAGLVKAENQRLTQIAKERSVALRADAEAAGVLCSAASLHTEYGEVMAEATRQSRVNDLTIVDTSSAALGAARSLAETVLFEGGRPILVVPPGCETFSCRRVIVAWDGGAMASRAVASALPLLRAAEEVEVLSIAGEKDLSKTVPGADLAAHLAHHNIKVSLKDLNANGRAVADVLRDQASMLDADLVVMGAYKHSRLRQWVLGGVTYSMLAETPTPLLMSH